MVDTPLTGAMSIDATSRSSCGPGHVCSESDYESSIGPKKPSNKIGRVSLVGAGPGDPELLTLKALRVIESADLILFDHLIGPEIRSFFPVAVPAFYVGKRKGEHSIPQEELNGLLLRKAQDGMHVVRLKGGDPFVFGRGGEELLALVEHGIEVNIVPGITAAAGCAASTKIPLTHRGIAQGCTFVTGFAESELALNWQALADLRHTLVFYMGLTRAADIQQYLLAAAMPAATPVAVIENGSRADERLFSCELAELETTIAKHSVSSPALIIVGEVVSLLQVQARAIDVFTPLHQQQEKCA